MNEDIAIKIQALVDGELPAAEHAAVESHLSNDPECRALRDELTILRSAIRGNELEVRVQDTREFYWNQIKRQIEAEDRNVPSTASTPGGFGMWLRQYLLPVTGVAAALLVLVTSIQQPSVSSFTQAQAHEDNEVVFPGSDSVTFRSETERVTLVWVLDKEDSLALGSQSEE